MTLNLLVSIIAALTIVLALIGGCLWLYIQTRPEARTERHVKQYVRHGALLLDAKFPDWYTRISTRHLNIMCSHDCLLGQLYGSYVEGIDALGLTSLNQREHFGFLPTVEAERAVGANAADKLYVFYWRYEILQRIAENT